MKLVIQIDDKLYTRICLGKDMSEEENDEMGCIIANGIRLPNRHGRLVDINEIMVNLTKYVRVAIFYDNDGERHIRIVTNFVDAPTIIEADEEVDDEVSD